MSARSVLSTASRRAFKLRPVDAAVAGLSGSRLARICLRAASAAGVSRYRRTCSGPDRAGPRHDAGGARFRPQRPKHQRALLIHCWAGISRSSAAAYAIACDRNPGFERDIAIELRRRSPSATPNRLMVRLADDLLQRDGRMVEAIDGDRPRRRGARRRAVCVAAEMALSMMRLDRSAKATATSS